MNTRSSHQNNIYEAPHNAAVYSAWGAVEDVRREIRPSTVDARYASRTLAALCLCGQTTTCGAHAELCKSSGNELMLVNCTGREVTLGAPDGRTFVFPVWKGCHARIVQPPPDVECIDARYGCAIVRASERSRSNIEGLRDVPDSAEIIVPRDIADVMREQKDRWSTRFRAVYAIYEGENAESAFAAERYTTSGSSCIRVVRALVRYV